MKKIFLLAIISIMALGANAQKVNGAFGLETAHLWRGYEVSNGLTMTGDMSYSFNNNLKVGIWGGRQVDGQYKEFDYYASYSTAGLTFSVWDIYNYSGHSGDKWADVFNYDQYTTGHFIDLGVAYNFAEKTNIPLALSWNTIVIGRDMDGNKRMFSTYVRAAYKIYDDGVITLTPAVAGAFKFNGDGEKNFYCGEHKANVTNVDLAATYKAQIGKYTLPITATATWSPENKTGHLGVAVNLISF